jgi:FMN phosphatase YigB (HAD superfamily)
MRKNMGQRFSRIFFILLVSWYPVSVYPITPQKIAVFDFGGVLFKTDTRKVLVQLGIRNLLYYFISTGKNPALIKHKLYEILNRLEAHTGNHPPLFDPQKDRMPSLMCNWLTGTKKTAEIAQLTLSSIKSNPTWFINKAEQALVHNLAHMMFSPTKFTHSQLLIAEGHALVKEFKRMGYTCCILSNWDESITLLKKKYPHFFALFDGEILISSAFGYAKPHPKTYEYIRNKYPHAEIVFLDDQDENLAAAEKYGNFKAIKIPSKLTFFGLIQSPDFSPAYQELSGSGVATHLSAARA